VSQGKSCTTAPVAARPRSGLQLEPARDGRTGSTDPNTEIQPASGKDPAKQRAGLAGARRRWGDAARVVRLADLSPEQRRLVLALVDAARREPVDEGQSR
jgi:hypothetical protein